ncbi:MAG: hypothetical protein ABI870_09200 [Rhodanobacter sp.]
MASETRQKNPHQRVQEAFNRLPLNKGAEFILQTAVQTITLLVSDQPGPYRPLPAFQRIGRARVAQEVEQVRLYAERCATNPRKGQADPFRKLSAHLDSLHGTTIDVLADHGLLRQGALDDPARTALLAATVDISGVHRTIPGGRPANLRALGIAKVLAWHYEQVTGKKPTLGKSQSNASAPDPLERLLPAYSQFVMLLHEILQIACITADAHALATAACEARKNRQGFR